MAGGPARAAPPHVPGRVRSDRSSRSSSEANHKRRAVPRRSEQLGQLRVLGRWIDGVDRPPPALALLGVGLGRRRCPDRGPPTAARRPRTPWSGSPVRRSPPSRHLPLDLDRLGLLGHDGLRRVDGRLDPLGQPEITLAGALDGKPHLGVELFEVGDDVAALPDETGDLLLDPARRSAASASASASRSSASLVIAFARRPRPRRRRAPARRRRRGSRSSRRRPRSGSVGLARRRSGPSRPPLGVERLRRPARRRSAPPPPLLDVERIRSASASASVVSRSALSWAPRGSNRCARPPLIARWITARRASSSPPLSSQSVSSAR